MNRILLDRSGLAPPPDGYRVVEDEVTFLRCAPDRHDLLVRGARLCDWAERYYAGHDVHVTAARDPVQVLRLLCPALSERSAYELATQLGWTAASMPAQFTLPDLLSRLFPIDLWHGAPSVRHGAAWLLWLWQEVKHGDDVAPLLEAMATQWQAQAEGSLRELYTAHTAIAARLLLSRWLGMTADTVIPWGEFPAPVSDDMAARARREWRRAITASQGNHFQHLTQLPLPRALLSVAAQETVAYIQKQPHQLTPALAEALAPHLSYAEQQALRRYLVPPQPSPLPRELAALVQWFEAEYLPYRLWQQEFGDDGARTAMLALGRDFALWYVEAYAQALVGARLRDYLSFRQPAPDPAMVTLVVVLDGLHWADGQQLEETLLRRCDRLILLARRAVFSPLPTVTALTKASLLRGVAPAHCGEVAELGTVIRDTADPIGPLAEAAPGSLLFWRIRDPDYTYHSRNHAATLSHDVAAALENVAAKLADIVAQVPAAQPLRLILTTDHGRLLGESARRLPAPAGMQTHGRAAWGAAAPGAFPPNGYVLAGDLLYLHAARFGLPTDAAICLGEDAFVTNDGQGGSERFAHGGLFPEEVLIPWIVLARDWQPPEVDLHVQGDGVAGGQGELVIQIVNHSDHALEVTALTLTFPETVRTAPLGEAVAPRGIATVRRPLTAWPTAAQCAAAQVQLQIRLATTRTVTISGAAALTSQELYSRTDDPLRDLGL